MSQYVFCCGIYICQCKAFQYKVSQCLLRLCYTQQSLCIIFHFAVCMCRSVGIWITNSEYLSCGCEAWQCQNWKRLFPGHWYGWIQQPADWYWSGSIWRKMVFIWIEIKCTLFFCILLNILSNRKYGSRFFQGLSVLL